MTKILYVDDDDDIREVAMMSLELEPAFDVRGAASGAEAIETVQAWQPDVILLDVMMPGLDGPGTLAEMRRLMGDALAPVLFCTARAQSRDVGDYLALGAVGVITKPFDPMTLASTVAGHLR